MNYILLLSWRLPPWAADPAPGKRKAAALIVQSRRWSYGRVKRAAVRRLFFLGRRPAVDYVDYIERKIAIPQKTESAESVPGY